MRLAYLRYSPKPRTKKIDDIAYSFAKQKDIIVTWLKSRGMAPIDQWFSDEETSARKVPLHKRPGGQKLLQEIEDGAREVVVWRVDRLFRDTIDGLTVLDDWEKKRVVLHSTDGVSMDVSTATGRFVATLLLGRDEFEPRLISERTSESMKSLQKQGRKVSSCAPYGKVLDGEELVDNPDEQAAIGHILHWHENGHGLREMVRMANQKNLPCRGKGWHHTSIQRLLSAHGQH